MSSIAFEITEEDVTTCVEQLAPQYQARLVLEEAFDLIDMDKVEAAALRGDDMDVQTQYAYEEIKAQLIQHVHANLFRVHPVRRNPDGSFDECEPDDKDLTAWAVYSVSMAGLLDHDSDWPTDKEAREKVYALITAWCAE